MNITEVTQNSAEVKRTERGWAGHLIASDNCRFRRNTLLECGKIKVVVSTVGNYHDSQGRPDEVGLLRDYETMAFYVDPLSKDYNDIDVERQIYFASPWALKIQEGDKFPDLLANDMHETVVQELTSKLEQGVKL